MELILALCVVVSVLVGFLVAMAKRSPSGPPSSPDVRTHSPVLVTRGVGVSAAEILRRVQQLQQADAQWPEIWQALNPDGDDLTQRLLVEIRGPYMFNPRLGLNMILIGCQRALASSPAADRASALRASLMADDKIVRPT